MDTFGTAAAAGFGLLAQKYLTEGIFAGAFWHAGNSLQTCLGYLLLTDQPDSHALLPNAYQIYSDGEGDPGLWRDDFGWWGIAFATAIKNRDRLGYASPSYDQLFSDIGTSAHDCWQLLCDNWRDTPYDGAGIRGGVFNTLLDQPLAGRNSVTNEVFWLLSQELAALEPSEPQYGRSAAAEQAWFQQWLDLQNAGGGNGILDADGLVLERPLGTPGDSDFHWSGDHGLFIAAQSASGQGALAGDIAQAVIEHMTDEDAVLHEYMGFQQKYGQFTADYATGKGVFMRWLASFNQQSVGQPYSDFILKNAHAVWCNQLGNDQFGFNWNPSAPYSDPEPKVLTDGKSQALCRLIMQTAGQDALNAALTVAPGTTSTCT